MRDEWRRGADERRSQPQPARSTDQSLRWRTSSARAALGFLFALLVFPLSATARDRLGFDAGWRFASGDDAARANSSFDDASWRKLDLPHDWSIEGAPSADAPSAGGGGFFPTGTGWYRKTFNAPRTWAGKHVRVQFEGVYENAEVWLNGTRVGGWPYGYTGFALDLTPHLRPGADNILAVRVDNSAQPNSRWYSGSGIYRHVWIEVLDVRGELRRDSLRVRTALSAERGGELAFSIDVQRPAGSAPLELRSAVYDSRGKRRAVGQHTFASLPTANAAPPASANTAAQTLEVRAPELWSPDSPALNRLELELFRGKERIDSLSIPIGWRTAVFSVERGFELNGKPLELFGACVHHDHGPLGAASFDAAEERKVRLLKAAGFNAVRTSHNPPAPAFLDACDRLGLLVIEESFDGWARKKSPQDYAKFFADWWRRDLTAMVARDQHRPSVILWSIGNEMYERGNAAGLKLTQEMSALVRELDATRGVTAGVNGLGKPEEWPKLDPLFAALDVSGYNYELHRAAADHARVPSRIMFAAESYQLDLFKSWSLTRDHAFVVGDFVWSGIDYLGEAGIGAVFPPGEKAVPHWEGVHFPWHGAYCGDIDITGWRKPISHFRAITWDRGEKLFAAVREPSADGRPWSLSQWSVPPALPSWTWPGHEGRPLQLEVFSRHPRVSVFLNDQLVAERATGEAEEFRALIEIPYAPGRLRVIGHAVGVAPLTGGRVNPAAGEIVLETAGAPSKLRLVAERGKFKSGVDDVVYATLEICDAQGRWCPAAQNEVSFTVVGPATIAGVATGNLRDSRPYVSPARTTYHGRALIAVRPTGAARKIVLTARAEGLAPSEITFRGD